MHMENVFKQLEHHVMSSSLRVLNVSSLETGPISRPYCQ